MKNYLILLILLVNNISICIAGEKIYSIKVFINDQVKINIDEDKYQSITKIINLDDYQNQQDFLNNYISRKVKSDPFLKSRGLEQSYINAFNEFQKTERWKNLSRKLEESANHKVYLVNHKVEKIPAFIINDKYHFYGIKSLSAVLENYKEYPNEG